MMGIINEVMKAYLAQRLKRIEQYMRQPEQSQERWLRKLLDAARDTEFGRRHGFRNIRNAEQYARQVPVQDYEDIRDAIQRMMHGQSDVLWPGEVNWYSKSSGTTSDRSKFIPVPYGNLFRNHIAGSWDSVALLYHNKPDMEIFRRKNLVLVGSYNSLLTRTPVSAM